MESKRVFIRGSNDVFLVILKVAIPAGVTIHLYSFLKPGAPNLNQTTGEGGGGFHGFL